MLALEEYRREMAAEIEERRQVKLKKAASVIQSVWRGWR